MASILHHINKLQQEDWDYYYHFEKRKTIKNPFTNSFSYLHFIQTYFKRSGKIEVLKNSEIDSSKLRFPNHICSVYFIGIVIYKKTKLSKKHYIDKNLPGYPSFQFLWFLITLFHDYAYEIELKSKSLGIDSLDQLYNKFDITEKLLNQENHHGANQLLNNRKQYFSYRLLESGKIDHGILAGILLYDRLIKIRRAKQLSSEDNLFWGSSLEKDYELAASAISIHNMWVADRNKFSVYRKYGLKSLINFKPLRMVDFPIFYLLGLIDTMDPIKTFTTDGFTDEEILNSIQLIVKKNSLTFKNKMSSKLDFSKLIMKTKFLKGWLKVSIKLTKNQIQLTFH